MKEGWEKILLGSVFSTVTGGTPSKSNENFYGHYIPFVKPPELRDSALSSAEDYLSKSGAAVARIAPPNSILVSCIGNLGKIGLNTVPVAFNQQINAILPNEDKALPSFIFYQTLAKSFKDQLESLASGTTVSIVNKSKFNAIEIILPSLPEQQRIVALLDEAFEAIASAKAHAEQNLKNARGLFESQLDAVFRQRGEGWVEKTLEELGTITSSKRIFKNEYVESGVPFYRTKEIKQLANKLPITTELFISQSRYDEVKSNSGVPKLGDVLLTAIGTIGEIYVVDGEGEFYFKDGNVLWLKEFHSIDSYFLKYVLRSFVDSLNNMAHGSAYSALPIQRLNAHRIFVPSIEEQRKIVAELDDLESESQNLESVYRRKIAALDELKASLLHKAFAGEL